MQDQSHLLSRRKFLGQAACSGFKLAGLLSAMGTMRLLNATLSAQGTPQDDYRALVCLFFFGGNDGNNVLVPRDTAGYQAYQTARGILALSQDQILPVEIPGGDGRQFGLHPSLGRMQSLFNQGKVAFLSNVGTLVAPITKAEFRAGGAAIPPYLFSHNDQQVQWQTSVPDSPKKVGWAGRLADLKQSLNSATGLSMNVSIAGNNFFQVGNHVSQYHLTTNGSVGFHESNSTWSPRKEQFAALRETLGMSYSHLFEAEYAGIVNRAIANDTLLKSTLAEIPTYDTGADNKFPNARTATGGLTPLAAQLRMVLRMIAARETLGMKRQIFFVSMGGFDTHDDQLNDHAALLQQIDAAIFDFYNATADFGVADKVTLFTASDFNRTFSSNGKGSDHAWGGHHFAVGGGVNGGQVYGKMPILQVGGPDDTGTRGSWIPTTSVDEYSATLAKWFGVTSSEMPLVLPNIGRFASMDLGFMK